MSENLQSTAMIYVKEWETLREATARVAQAYGDLKNPRPPFAMQSPIIRLRYESRSTLATTDTADTFFSAGNVNVPPNLAPSDFDWSRSRPLRPWPIGPQLVEHYFWAGGWQSEPIGLVEVLRSDVSNVLKCGEADLISYQEATALLCHAKFGDDWIRRLSGYEEYLLNKGWAIEVTITEWEAVTAKASECEIQLQWAGDWLEERGYLKAMLRDHWQPIPPFSRAAFEQDFLRDFPKANAFLRTSTGIEGKEDVAQPARSSRRPKSAPKSKIIEQELQKHGFDKDRQGKEL